MAYLRVKLLGLFHFAPRVLSLGQGPARAVQGPTCWAVRAHMLIDKTNNSQREEKKEKENLGSTKFAIINVLGRNYILLYIIKRRSN